MSLISDALKKAQREREQFQDDGEPPDPIKGGRLYSHKRLLFYGGLVIIIVIAVIMVTVVFAPKEETQMRAMNIRGGQSSVQPPVQSSGQPSGQPPAVKTPKQEQPKPQEEQVVPEPRPREIKGAESENKDIKKEKLPVEEKVSPKAAVPKEEKAPAVAKAKKQPSKIEQVKEPPQKPKGAGKVETVSVSELVRQGDDLVIAKEYLSAVEKYKAALQIEKTPDLYLKLYGVFKEMNNNVLATAYIEEGLKQYPGDFFLNKTAAIIYIRGKDFQKALIYAKKAVEINSADYTLYTYLGLCYFHHGDYDQALEPLQKSLELNSDAVENYYYIGLIFDNRKEYRKALEYYNVFFKLNPDNRNFKHREWIIQRMKTLEEYLNRQ